MADQSDSTPTPPSDPSPSEAETTPPDPAATGQPAAAGAVGATAAPTTSADSSWPGSAKGTTAVLAIIAVAAIIAAIVGFSQASSSDSDKSDAESDLAAVQQERDDANAQLEEMSSEMEEASATIETLTTERDDALAANEELETELAAETQRADDAAAEVAELTARYPLEFDSTLDPTTALGDYSIEYSEVFCAGLPDCGTVPPGQATVYNADNGNLTIRIDGLMDAGLRAFGSSFYAVDDSTVAIPPCNGVERVARVALSLYARTFTVAEDGTQTVTRAGGSMSVSAPDAGPGCPAGSEFYDVTVNPAG